MSKAIVKFNKADLAHYCKIKYIVITVTSDQGSLIALLEVPTHVVTSQNTALPGHHKAENYFSAS